MSFSSSERRGILAVGLVALLIIAFSLFFGFCHRNVVEESPQEVQLDNAVDSVAIENAKKEASTKKGKKKGGSAQKTKTTNYHYRHPIDETVSP